MKRNGMKTKITALLLLLVLLITAFTGCKDKNIDPNDPSITRLSFKAASGYDYLKTLDGKAVTISGYMATSSPVDGSFMFLMNLPYQSCPFCKPNTSELSNTMEIYPKKGESFSYTTQAIQVVGILEVSDSEDEPFTDMYGYKFCCKVVDATYTIIKAEDMSADMALWQSIASTDVVNDIYSMYDYVNFLCAWNTYFVNDFTDKNGNLVKGYYLYASDAEGYIYTDGGQYNYGYKDGYFDSIVKKIESVDKDAFADLVKNVREAEALAERALSDLENKRYTYSEQYVEKFDTVQYIFTLDNGEELTNEMDRIYTEFANWLGSWEM